MRHPFTPLPTPPFDPEDWLIVILAIICFLALLVKDCHGQELPIFEKEKAAQWIQLEYTNFYHGQKTISSGYALGLADSLALDCFVLGLNFDDMLSQFTWESNWVNMIRFKKLRVKCWSFGMVGLTVDTAQEEAIRLRSQGFDIDKFNAHDLIANVDLNLLLGCGQMLYLLDIYKGDSVKAEIAYNAGKRGLLLGRGKRYPVDLFETLSKWKKFKQSRLK